MFIFNNNSGQGGAAICEMMFCSSLVATAGSGESTTTSPRKVHIINTKVQLDYVYFGIYSFFISIFRGKQ